MQINFNLNERYFWIGAVIIALVVGFFVGKQYGNSHTQNKDGWKFEWKIDKLRPEVQP